jgi:hypothetical protein
MPYLIQLPLEELQQLIVDLGVVEQPARFGLSEVVSPVSLVDSRVTVDVNSVPWDWEAAQTQGEFTNAAANTRHVDTGALDQGVYDFLIYLSVGNTVGFRVKQRNAADAATVYSQVFTAGGASINRVDMIFHLAQGERVVVDNTGATGAGILSQCTAFYRKR